MKFYSPLRYPGGKKSLSKYLIFEINENQPISTIMEPFAGGLGLSLELYSLGIIKNIICNDADENIYLFWKSVLSVTDFFIQKIFDTPIDLNEWHKQKEILFNEEIRSNSSELDIGFATFFINRCSRSGMITKNVGPIGGKNQKSIWKIDARFNKNDLISRIEYISRIGKAIQLHCEDAIKFMGKRIRKNQRNTIFYLDPPYYFQGKNLYRIYYETQDHIILRNFLKEHDNIKWIISYDFSDYISNLYSFSKNKSYISFDHHANNHIHRDELLVGSNSLKWVI